MLSLYGAVPDKTLLLSMLTVAMPLSQKSYQKSLSRDLCALY